MEPFPLTAAEIDAIARSVEGSADYHLSSAFWKEAKAEGLSQEKAEAFRLLGFVLSLPFRPKDAAHPFGDARNNNSFENLTIEQAAELENLASDIKTAQIRARLADVAWARKRGSPNSARLAVSAYIESARALEDPQEWTECANRVERAARLSRSLGIGDESFASVSGYLLEIADKYRGNDPMFLTGKIVELLLEFEIGNPVSYVDCLSNAAAHARVANEFYRCRYYLDVLAKLHGYRNDMQARNTALRELAVTFELEAEHREKQGDNLVAVHFLNQAIQAHRRIPDSASNVEALRPKLQRVERASIAQFKKISVPLDTGESTIAARRHVTGVSTSDAILRFAHISPIANFEGMKKIVIEAASIAPLSHIIAGSAVDSEGRTVGLKPGLSLSGNEQDEAMFAHVVEQMRIQRLCNVQGIIMPALDQVISEHAITLQEMKALASYSPFVPSGREQIFSEGLYAGFSRDFLSAMHLLVPQIENSFRYLMQEQNMITTKLDKNGVQRQIDLNELVVDQRLSAIISPNILFELRCLMTDNRGPNLRNQLAHGMLDDGAFFSVEAVYAWRLVLLLCIFSPVVKTGNNSSENAA